MSLPLLNGIPFLGGITIIENGLFFDGTAVAPSIAFFSEPGLGIYKVANGFGFAQGGAAFGSLYNSGGLILQGSASGAYLQLSAAGQVTIGAAGVNQNLTLAPSGTGAIILSEIAFPNDALNNGFSVRFGADGTHGPLNFGIGGYPSATGTNRYVTIEAGDMSAYRRICFTGNAATLFGTITDSANGRIQLVTHTTSAGGIGFGVETSLYRQSAGVLAIDHIGGTTAALFLRNNGVVKAAFELSSDNAYLGTYTAGASLTLRSGNQVAAITIDSTQNSLFGGNLTAPAAGNHGWTGRSLLASPADGALDLTTNAAAAASSLGFGTAGAATSARIFRKYTSGIGNAAATAVMTITIPNAAHAARIKIQISGVLGAGGAIGACEASQAVVYDCVIVRTAGVNAVATLSAVAFAVAANVAGATTCTTTAALSAVSGGVGASNSFTLNVTISRAGGASTNHTCHLLAEILNQNATGITLS